MAELTEQQIEEGNKRINKFIAGLPQDKQVAFEMISQHLPNGATWGFDTDIAGGARAGKRAAEASNGKLIYFELANGGAIEYLNGNELFDVYSQLIKIGGLELSPKVVEKARKRRNDSAAVLHKFLSEGKTGVVGFFNTNSTDTFTINGVTHPSFALNARDFLGLLAQHNYKVKTSKGNVAGAHEAAKGITGFMSELEKSPSSNAVLVELVR